MTIEEEDVNLLKECGALLEDDHFVYLSGLHGTAYVNKDAIFLHTRVFHAISCKIAEEFLSYGIQAVVGPAIGGACVSQMVAFELARLRSGHIVAAYAEKNPDGSFAFRRGYDKAIHGLRTLVVEDVLNSGSTCSRVAEAACAAGAIVIGAAALINRGGALALLHTARDAGRVMAVIDVSSRPSMRTWTEAQCAIDGPCSRGIPVNTNYGHGAVYLWRKYQGLD